MKYLISTILLLISLPALAQGGGIMFSQILLSIAILLGLSAGSYVFYLGRRMAGSNLATALNMYGLGMLSIVISLLSVTWAKDIMGGYAGWFHDGFFILGFIVMVVGSRKVAGIL